MPESRNFLLDFFRLTKQFWCSKRKLKIRGTVLLLALLTILQMVMAVLLNRWSAGLFNALEQHSMADLMTQIGKLAILFVCGIVLTGSHNWSSAAENSNNENTFVLHDPDVANQYLQEFSARYLQFGGTDSVVVTDVTPGDLPRAVSLAQNSPNPFRGATSIVYTIPSAQDVSLRVYDLQGREVRRLVDQPQAAGRYRVDLSLPRLSSGTYFYRLQVGKLVRERKMVLLK